MYCVPIPKNNLNKHQFNLPSVLCLVSRYGLPVPIVSHRLGTVKLIDSERSVFDPAVASVRVNIDTQFPLT